MDENTKNMRDIPVYPYPFLYARERGEQEQFRESARTDKACRKAIDAAISETWDGMRLSDGAAKGVLEQFGPERVAWTLADELQRRNTDRRFSRSNQAWARTMPMFMTTEMRWSESMESHPVKLNEFVSQVRQEVDMSPIVESRCKALKAIPLYQHSMEYAMQHGENAQFFASHEANSACREAIEAAIALNYRDNRLGDAGAKQVVEQYGFERTFYVLANTVRHQEWDHRISSDNIKWAKTQPECDAKSVTGEDLTQKYIVGRTGSPGLTDIFLNQVREQYALEQERTAAQEQPENPLKNAEMLTEDDASMIDGIINNGVKDTGPPKAEQSGAERQEDRKPQGKRSIRAQLAEKPQEPEKAAPKPRSREAAL